LIYFYFTLLDVLILSLLVLSCFAIGIEDTTSKTDADRSNAETSHRSTENSPADEHQWDLVESADHAIGSWRGGANAMPGSNADTSTAESIHKDEKDEARSHIIVDVVPSRLDLTREEKEGKEHDKTEGIVEEHSGKLLDARALEGKAHVQGISDGSKTVDASADVAVQVEAEVVEAGSDGRQNHDDHAYVHTLRGGLTKDESIAKTNEHSGERLDDSDHGHGDVPESICVGEEHDAEDHVQRNPTLDLAQGGHVELDHAKLSQKK